MPITTPSHNHTPCGHKKGEGSSRAFTQSKKPSVMTNRLLLGILFPKKNAVILSPFYARCIPKATTSIPAGHKKGEGSSRAFTPSKKPCASNNRLLLGILFPKKYAVILSPFYACCIPKPQPQSQPGIKREKDLAELLRRPKSQAQATIACCLASPFSKKNPGQHAPTGIF